MDCGTALGSRHSLMWRRLLTTQEGRAQPRTWEAPAAFISPQGICSSSPPLLSAEKLATGHALLPHRWLGIHQDCA